MAEWHGWEFLQTHYGNIASVAGFFLTCVAAWKAWKSQQAAQEARDAAKQSSQIVSTFLNLAEFERLMTLVTNLIDYISETENFNKNHVRKSCDYIKSSLISMKSNVKGLEDTHHQKMQSFIHFLSECEKIQIEQVVRSTKKAETIKTTMSRELNEHKTAMQEIVAELRSRTGEKL